MSERSSSGLSSDVLGALPVSASSSPSESVSIAEPSTVGRSRRLGDRRRVFVGGSSADSKPPMPELGVSHASFVVAKLEHVAAVSSVTRLVDEAEEEHDEALCERKVSSPVDVEAGSGGSGLPSCIDWSKRSFGSRAGVGSDVDRLRKSRGGTGSEDLAATAEAGAG